jgi:hypothetical protein
MAAGADRVNELKYTPLLSSSFWQLDWHGVKVRAVGAYNCTSIDRAVESRIFRLHASLPA